MCVCVCVCVCRMCMSLANRGPENGHIGPAQPLESQPMSPILGDEDGRVEGLLDEAFPPSHLAPCRMQPGGHQTASESRRQALVRLVIAPQVEVDVQLDLFTRACVNLQSQSYSHISQAYCARKCARVTLPCRTRSSIVSPVCVCLCVCGCVGVKRGEG